MSRGALDFQSSSRSHRRSIEHVPDFVEKISHRVEETASAVFNASFFPSFPLFLPSACAGSAAQELSPRCFFFQKPTKPTRKTKLVFSVFDIKKIFGFVDVFCEKTFASENVRDGNCRRGFDPAGESDRRDASNGFTWQGVPKL